MKCFTDAKNLKSKEVEHIARRFANCIPQATNFNNKKTHQYLSSNKIRANACGIEGNNLDPLNESSLSTIKDSLLITETLDSKLNNRNHAHKRTRSKNISIINNNVVVTTFVMNWDVPSLPKVSYKIPAKELDESESMREINESEHEEETRLEEEFDKRYVSRNVEVISQNVIDYETLYKILSDVYSVLLENIQSWEIFIKSYKFNFGAIEKWFDISASVDLIGLIGQSTLSNLSLEDVKRHCMFEVITFGFILYLYQFDVKGKGAKSAKYHIAFSIFNYISKCTNKLYENILCIIFLSRTNNIQISNSTQPVEENGKGITTPERYEDLLFELIVNYYKNQQLDPSKMQNSVKENISSIHDMLHQTIEIIINYYYNGGVDQVEDPNGSPNQKVFNDEVLQELRNLENVFYLMRDIEKARYDDIRELIYNDYLLGNLVKLNLYDKTSQIDEEEESDTENIITINCKEKKANQNNNTNNPFLPPLNQNKYEYTLVVDLDETLVHYVEDGEEAFVQVRPFAEFFLKEMNKYFEIVIFTAATEEYADIVLNELDKTSTISHKLYRRHTLPKNNTLLKDLSKLGRDLTKTIIIDNMKENFILQPENGLQISTFTGNENDTELNELSKDLLKLVVNKVPDVRNSLEGIRMKMNQRYKV